MSAARLTLRFTRISPTHHRFEYVRPDGSGEAIEMETRSLLRHDLLHYAVESEAGLQGSFYGILAKIGGYQELAVAGGGALGGEIAITERIVGPLSEALKAGPVEPETFIAQLAGFLEACGERPPAWLTTEVLERVGRRMRELEGRWKATPFGESLELEFPLRA